ncbi:hypothetical protein IAR50_006535 [Cryptococcus sp. DSM 104548]
MSDKKQNSLVPHMLAILLALSSTIFFFLVVIYNVPFSSSDRSNLSRMWLLTMKVDLIGFSKYKDSFWKITYSTEGDVQALNPPYSITHSLSTAAFMLNLQ